MKGNNMIQPAPLPPLLTPVQRESSSIWMQSVVAPFMQNIVGGLGVFVLALIVGTRFWSLDRAAPIALYAAGFVFGIACAVRAFRDEIGMVLSAFVEHQLTQVLEALQVENDKLVAELERLKSEGMVAHAWGAREAAERLVLDYYADQSNEPEQCLGRAPSMQRGMTRAQWEQGTAFLQHAGILQRDMHGRIWQAVSHDVALAMIARHAASSRTLVRAANGDMSKL